ncbi:unnamed protein product [Closterium sp. NIES-65]|nr:unnamed protein product [Closterium sp. NIES-65]
MGNRIMHRMDGGMDEKGGSNSEGTEGAGLPVLLILGKALRIVLTYARDENLGALGGKEAIQSPSASLATHSFAIESFHEDVLKRIQETNNCDSVSEAVRLLLHHVQAAVSEAILFGLVRCKRPLNCTSCPAHAAAAAAKVAPSAAPAAAE